MLRTLRLPGQMKLPDAILQLIALPSEVSRIGDHQLRVGWTVPGERLVVAIERSKKRSQQSSNQSPWKDEPARGHVESGRTMRHHLRHVHLAP